MKNESDEELSSMTASFSEPEYIEVKDFVKLESEGKRQKDVLYIIHGSPEEIETLRSR